MCRFSITSVSMLLLATASISQASPTKSTNLWGWVFATSPTDQIDAGQHFQKEIFKKEPLHISRSFNRSYYESTVPLQELWPTLPENSTTSHFLAINGNPIDIRVDGQKVSTSDSLNEVLASNVLDHEAIPDKTSFIIKFEELTNNGVAIEQLEQRFAGDSVPASSIHGYYSAAGGSKALHAHTDPYDVVILQIVGSKHWTMCVPPSNSTPQVSTAESAIQYAKDHADGNSCVSYNADTLKSLTCTKFVMEAGDALYLPRDVIHFAETEDSASVHLTIGLGGDHNENCDDDNLNSFERDVMPQQQRSRRYCSSSCSSYGTTYCDTSCDLSCDSCYSSYSYSCYTYYYSCDSGCDDGCDLGCGSYTSTSYCSTTTYTDSGSGSVTTTAYCGYYPYGACADKDRMDGGVVAAIAISVFLCCCCCFAIPMMLTCWGPGGKTNGSANNAAVMNPAHVLPNDSALPPTPQPSNGMGTPPPYKRRSQGSEQFAGFGDP